MLASGFSATAGLSWASWVNTGWLHDWVGVFGGVENPEAAKRFKTRWSYGAIGTRHRSNQRSEPTAAVTQHSQLYFPRTFPHPFPWHGDLSWAGLRCADTSGHAAKLKTTEGSRAPG